MPAGISWPRYISATVAVMLSMLAGSQTVHLIYQPLRDLSERVEVEKEKLRIAEIKRETLSSSDSSSPDAQAAFSSTS